MKLLSTYEMAHYTVRVFTVKNTKLKKVSIVIQSLGQHGFIA